MADPRLAHTGLKSTKPRRQVLDMLEQPEVCCLSAGAIYQSLMDAGEQVSQATIYRVLGDLEEAGLLVGHYFDGEQKEYGLAERAGHDHMLCEETGTVIKFDDPTVTRHLARLAAEHGYDIVPGSLSFRVRPAGDKR